MLSGLVALLALALFALLHVSFFYSLYSWLFGHIVSLTGYDIWLSRAVTIALLGAVSYFFWDIVLAFWFQKSGKRLAIVLGSTAVMLLAMGLLTRGVFFSRTDGSPAKFYIRTLNGYTFSSSEGPRARATPGCPSTRRRTDTCGNGRTGWPNAPSNSRRSAWSRSRSTSRASRWGASPPKTSPTISRQGRAAGSRGARSTWRSVSYSAC